MARPDEVGSRPGRAVVIPVLRNDDDPDGDVIAVEEVGRVDPSQGVVRIARNGLQVQFTPRAGFVGAAEFDYTISDGRGGMATSTVTVRVVDADGSNRPPEVTDDLVATSRTSAVSFNVLENDTDPDGDSIYLADAHLCAGRVGERGACEGQEFEGRVDFSAEGLITYFPDAADPDSGASGTGEVTVRYVVKDDRGDTAEGRMRVRLRSAHSNQPPDARNDVVTVRVGRIARLTVLDNDHDPDGDPLRLSVRPTDPVRRRYRRRRSDLRGERRAQEDPGQLRHHRRRIGGPGSDPHRGAGPASPESGARGRPRRRDDRSRPDPACAGDHQRRRS